MCGSSISDTASSSFLNPLQKCRGRHESSPTRANAVDPIPRADKVVNNPPGAAALRRPCTNPLPPTSRCPPWSPPPAPMIPTTPADQPHSPPSSALPARLPPRYLVRYPAREKPEPVPSRGTPASQCNGTAHCCRGLSKYGAPDLRDGLHLQEYSFSKGNANMCGVAYSRHPASSNLRPSSAVTRVRHRAESLLASPSICRHRQLGELHSLY